MKSVERIKEYFETEEIQEERHNQAYEGCLFSIDQHLFRSRLAKKTPKKKGYFVVFWEKDSQQHNQAYSFEESPDRVIVTVIDDDKCGQFLFPKEVLRKQSVLRTEESKGKMALRVYPNWEKDLSDAALKTQKWQSPYFISLTQGLKREALRPFYFG